MFLCCRGASTKHCVSIPSLSIASSIRRQHLLEQLPRNCWLRRLTLRKFWSQRRFTTQQQKAQPTLCRLLSARAHCFATVLHRLCCGSLLLATSRHRHDLLP